MTRRIFIVPMIVVFASAVLLGCGGDETQHEEHTDLDTGIVVHSKAVCFHGSHGKGGWQSAWTEDRTVSEGARDLHKEENPDHLPGMMTKKNMWQ